MPVPDSYQNLVIPPTPPGATFTDSNPSISNVEAKFANISDQASHLHVRDGALYPFLRYTNVDEPGVNFAKNHIQGVQRLRNSNYMLISAGDKVIERSHLFVARLASRRSRGYWGTNILTQKDPPDDDSMVQIFALDGVCWHAGGINIMGDAVAIPVYSEGPDPSKIIFLDVSDPEHPTMFPQTLVRSGARSNAVAMAKMPNGRYLCAVWREVQTKPQGRIDFHVSVDTDFRNGFGAGSTMWNFADLQGLTGGNRTYQSINFIMPSDIAQDTSSAGRTVFYLVGTENEAIAAPIQFGADIADLIRVEFPNSLFDDPPGNDKPNLTRLATRKFHVGHDFANFDAAAGVYVASDDTLALYGGYHWRHRGVFGFAEFPPLGDDAAPGGIWVELFEDRDFQGRRLTLRNKTEAFIRNFAKVSVQGKGFDDKISSLRFFAPPGETLVLYEHKNFDESGRKVVLPGTGTVQKVPNLDAHGFQMDDDGSSLRFL